MLIHQIIGIKLLRFYKRGEIAASFHILDTGYSLS